MASNWLTIPDPFQLMTIPTTWLQDLRQAVRILEHKKPSDKD